MVEVLASAIGVTRFLTNTPRQSSSKRYLSHNQNMVSARWRHSQPKPFGCQVVAAYKHWSLIEVTSDRVLATKDRLQLQPERFDKQKLLVAKSAFYSLPPFKLILVR